MNNENNTTTNQQTTNDKQTICISLLKYNLNRRFIFFVWCGGGVVVCFVCGVV
jgi:hypothetical protein